MLWRSLFARQAIAHHDDRPDAHVATVFIKDFAPDYSSSNSVSAPLAHGPFSLSLPTDPGEGRHIQFGFTVRGENVWVTDTAPFGTAVIALIFVGAFILMRKSLKQPGAKMGASAHRGTRPRGDGYQPC